ncbi:MAG TPA: DUF6263 family protein [Chitinophagaceae bacterium]|jgi:hypothetical protein|nr:DUF6263 family protein [Chitinophagaceae bacterium]
MQQFKLPVLVILCLVSMNALAQQTKINVKKGEQYQVEATTKTTSSADVMGQSMESAADTRAITLLKIVDVEPAEIKMESTLTKMRLTATAMGQNSSYDSEKQDNEGPLADAFKSSINKTKTVKLDNKGVVTKEDAPEDDPMAMLGVSGNSSSNDLFISSLIGIELKVGDSYLSANEINSEKLSSRDSGAYKVTAIGNGVASISYAGTQVVTMQMEQMGQSMTNNSTNTIKSELQIDMNTGRVLVKASVTETNGTIEVGGMSIPITGKTIATTTITQLK